jgi:ribosomal protein S18 acetylase RimI-like enzyme
MTDVEEIEASLRATLAVFAEPNDAGETADLPGVTLSCSGIQFSMFNSAILTAPVATASDLDRRIRAAGEFFRSRRFAWSFWICAGWLERDVRAVVQDVCARNGLHLVVELPGMIAERLAPPRRPLPRLQYRRVNDAVTRADFNRIMSIAFGIPFPVSRAIYESEKTWQTGFAGWIGYAGDLPVASTATIVTGSVAGVYAVGTLPTHQRKGYGEAVMRHALAEIERETGITRTVLQSSEAGYSLYSKLGYRTFCRYAVFASNP